MHVIVLTSRLAQYTDDSGFAPNEQIVAPSILLNLAPRRLLGDWYPFYEVFLRGKVYRRVTKNHTEHLRCVAPGLRSDGAVLTLGDSVPNTPTALIREISAISGHSMAVVSESAFDLLKLASDRNWGYGVDNPGNLPEAYRFKNAFQTTVNKDGSISSLFDNPGGRDLASWRVAVGLIFGAPDATIDELVSDSGNARLFGEKAYLRLVQLAKAVRLDAVRGVTRGTYRVSAELERIGSGIGAQSSPVVFYKG